MEGRWHLISPLQVMLRRPPRVSCSFQHSFRHPPDTSNLAAHLPGLKPPPVNNTRPACLLQSIPVSHPANLDHVALLTLGKGA